MRTTALYIMVALFAMATLANTVSAAGLFDTPGIEVSRAGLQDRQSTQHMQVLQYSPDSGSYVVRDLSEDRVGCGPATKFRKTIKLLYENKVVTVEELLMWAKALQLPFTCMMEVQSSVEPTLWHIAILDPIGDFVIFSDGKITTWQELDHRSTQFDTLALDRWTVLGIAPAGQLAMPEEPMTSAPVPAEPLPAIGPKPLLRPSS